MAVITINGVAKSFGGTVVLKGVDLSILDSRIAAFHGSGAYGWDEGPVPLA